MWNKEAIEIYRKETEERCLSEKKVGKSVEEKWAILKDIIQEAMVKKKIKKRRRKIGFKDWSCIKQKRAVQRRYRSWRKGKGRKEDYMQEKGRWRELQERKQKDKRKEEEEELRKIRRESEIWKYINRKKGKRQ